MRGLGLVAAGFAAMAAFAAAPLSPRQHAEDFESMWRALDEGYAYFERGRGAWKQARDKWKPRAARATSRADFVAALEGALGELRDDHVDLSEHTSAYGRRVPYDTDIWVAWRDGAALVESVRTYGDADVAGLRPGLVITRVGNVPVDRIVRERLGSTTASIPAQEWALRHALNGPAQGAYRLEVRDGRRSTTLEIERGNAAKNNGPIVIGRRMGEERDLGYLRLRLGADDARLAEHFDAALHSLRDTRALIVDLRENVGPGSRAVTQAILGRFVGAPAPWQLREPRGQPKVTDSVAPRSGALYRKPVVVLVDRWTAGEGEALAAGLAAVAGARLVGTKTAGLRGDTREVRLPHSGITVRFPAEKTFLVSGEPRESLRPHVPVDLAAPSGGPGDPILYQALKLLERR